jgi:hypothetical protein
VRALAEGNSLRATARIVPNDKDAACGWFDRAAQHCRTVMLYLWCNLHVTECQMGELWSFVHTKERIKAVEGHYPKVRKGASRCSRKPGQWLPGVSAAYRCRQPGLVLKTITSCWAAYYRRTSGKYANFAVDGSAQYLTEVGPGNAKNCWLESYDPAGGDPGQAVSQPLGCDTAGRHGQPQHRPIDGVLLWIPVIWGFGETREEAPGLARTVVLA